MEQRHSKAGGPWRPGEGTPHIRLSETILRDGLQAMPQTALDRLTVDRKLELIRALAGIGIQDIEVTSFAHPRVLPQFADASEMISRLPTDLGVTFRAVTPNLKGLSLAVDAGAAGVVTMTGMLVCSEEYQIRNVGKSIDAGLDGLHEMYTYAQQEGVRLIAGAGVAFECPYAGPIHPDQVLSIIGKLHDIGFDEVWLGDTFGMASSPQVFSLLTRVREAYPSSTFGLHLHNRHGLGLVNFLAGIDAGIELFDTSLLGVGAGSVIPGNRTEMGNIATEEVAHLIESLELNSGIDLKALRDMGLSLAEELDLPARSRILRTGLGKRL